MGGFIGAELAIQFPARVERLVLVSAAGLTIETRSHRDALLAALRALETCWRGGSGLAGRALGRTSRGGRAAPALMLRDRRPPATGCPAPLVAEQVRGSGKPGFSTRSTR